MTDIFFFFYIYSGYFEICRVYNIHRTHKTYDLQIEKRILSFSLFAFTSSMYTSQCYSILGLLVFLQLRIRCKQEEQIHGFCRPYPNTCHSSVKPVWVTVLWDLYRVCTVSSIEGYLPCWLSFCCAFCGNIN